MTLAAHPEPHPCILCRRPTRADSQTCPTCYLRIADHLDRLVELYALTADEMLGTGAAAGRSSDQPLGLRLAALDYRATLAGNLAVLATWERDWRETWTIEDPLDVGTTRPDELDEARHRYARGAHDQVHATLLGVTTFLTEHLHRACREHPAIDEFAADVARAYTDARNAARQTNPQTWIITCPTDECGRPLRITGSDFDTQVTCRGCNRAWDVTWLLRVTASEGTDVWLDPVSAALLVGVAERTLRRWASAGSIRRGHGLYEAGSIYAHTERLAVTEGA